MRPLLAALLLIVTRSVSHAAESPPSPPQGCAYVDLSDSSAYESGGQEHFNLKFKVPMWVPTLHIEIDFGEPVDIEHVHQGAEIVDQYYYGGEGAPKPTLAQALGALTRMAALAQSMKMC